MEDRTAQLEALFQEVGHQHHEAFLETDGADPEWPLWYADWLKDRLPPMLGTELTKSELVYLLIHLGKEQAQQEPDMPWARFYAEYLAKEYVLEDAG
jgi:NAD(P)H-hydrate epimerase